uniref:Uncharacterized protein n=1 Tax=Lepeophtheirus salmonis TaxID=72036 RepID=A0A0K2T5G8_LEPSM
MVLAEAGLLLMSIKGVALLQHDSSGQRQLSQVLPFFLQEHRPSLHFPLHLHPL